jgi:hypothetical protein
MRTDLRQVVEDDVEELGLREPAVPIGSEDLGGEVDAHIDSESVMPPA